MIADILVLIDKVPVLLGVIIITMLWLLLYYYLVCVLLLYLCLRVLLDID